MLTMRVALIALCCAALSGAARAECPCPPESTSSDLLLSTAPGQQGGLVACGFKESNEGNAVRASEFQVFRCGRPEPLLELGALDTAVLQAEGESLRILRTARWPFGRDWAWIDVPLAELILRPESQGEQRWSPRLPKPQASPEQVREELRAYRQWLAAPQRDNSVAEDMVGRLFAAMATGDREAARLFRSMVSDASLDGHDAEMHAMAVEEYRLGTGHELSD